MMETYFLKMKLNKNKLNVPYIKPHLENNSKCALIHRTNNK